MFLLSLFLTLLLIGLFSPSRLLLAVNTTSQVDDDTLVSQAQAGDRQAFNRLVGRHQTLMYNIAYRVMGDSDKAADATQDAFLSAYKKLDQYKGGNFRAWLGRIVRNQCYDLLRYEKRRPAASLDALLLKPDDPPPALNRKSPERPDQVALGHEVSDWLQQVILQLRVDQRMTLVMADVHGYSYEEIAQVTGVELGTVKSRLSRARRKVRKLLQEHSELLPAKYRL
jgi:RNA polymerase sigma-70 factor (ECF subfamily)